MNEETIENRPLACITGASSGIGLELARVFAKNGFDLLIAAENKQIHEVAKELRAFGVDVESCQMDLSTYDGVEDLYTKIETMPAPLDTLCLNAGVGVSGNFTTTSLEDELNLIQLNIVSLVHLCKLVLPDMEARDYGRIMFTSSIAATMPGPYFAVYAASKAFVQSFAEALYTEFEETGITVMALQPGPTDTNFFERAEMMDTPAGQGKKDEPAKVAEQAYNALMKEKDHIVAGSLKNKLQATVAKFVSQHKGSEMQGKQTKPQQ
jgi:short-subunit dehydrogenase